MNLNDFKFRIWNYDSGEYFLDVGIARFDKCLMDTQESFNMYGGIGSEAELELCTGLQDKNGKDIYEGDIVSYRGHENRIIEYINGQYMLVLPLEHYQGDRQMQIDCSIRLFRLWENKSLDSIEVIGNIHDAELLKGTK